MRVRPREYKLGSYLKKCDRCGMQRYIEDLRRQEGKDYCPECLDEEDEYPHDNK